MRYSGKFRSEKAADLRFKEELKEPDKVKLRDPRVKEVPLKTPAIQTPDLTTPKIKV